MDVTKESLTSAVNASLQHLQIKSIDLLLLSFPSNEYDDYKHVWTVLEDYVKSGAVESIGVSDFDLPDFQKLYESATVSNEGLQGFSSSGFLCRCHKSRIFFTSINRFLPWQVKPSVDQVNLESCCVIPPELSDYAKKHGLQLLTHNDPRSKKNDPRVFILYSEVKNIDGILSFLCAL